MLGSTSGAHVGAMGSLTPRWARPGCVNRKDRAGVVKRGSWVGSRGLKTKWKMRPHTGGQMDVQCGLITPDGGVLVSPI